MPIYVEARIQPDPGLFARATRTLAEPYRAP